jgi:hypothetical protein
VARCNRNWQLQHSTKAWAFVNVTRLQSWKQKGWAMLGNAGQCWAQYLADSQSFWCFCVLFLCHAFGTDAFDDRLIWIMLALTNDRMLTPRRGIKDFFRLQMPQQLCECLSGFWIFARFRHAVWICLDKVRLSQKNLSLGKAILASQSRRGKSTRAFERQLRNNANILEQSYAVLTRLFWLSFFGSRSYVEASHS